MKEYRKRKKLDGSREHQCVEHPVGKTVHDAKDTEGEKFAKQGKQKAYMKEYITKRKNNETESEKFPRQEKQNRYVRECNRKRKSSPNEIEELLKKQKRAEYMKEYRKRKKHDGSRENQCADNPVWKTVHDTVDKETFISVQ